MFWIAETVVADLTRVPQRSLDLESILGPSSLICLRTTGPPIPIHYIGGRHASVLHPTDGVLRAVRYHAGSVCRTRRYRLHLPVLRRLRVSIHRKSRDLTLTVIFLAWRSYHSSSCTPWRSFHTAYAQRV